jgi:ribose transport system permease protein
VRKALSKSYLILVLLAFVLIGFIASPNFLTSRNASNVVTFSAIVSVLAVGQFFVILTGGIDLSVASVVALATVVSALLLKSGHSAATAAVLTLLICAAVGFVNGLLVVGLRIAPFIATLATMSAIQGLSYVIQSSSLIQISNSSFITFFSEGSILGLRSPVLIFVLVMLVAGFAARYTNFGRRLYAVGGNREAARLSGLPVSRDLLITYTLSGALAGLAGLLAAAQLLEGSSLIGQGYELDAIAAAVIGGTSLSGGEGSILGTVIGAFIISTLTNGLRILSVPQEWQTVVTGGIVIVAVYLDIVRRRQRS